MAYLSLSEFWSIIQRQLAFAEPKAKWLYLEKILCRLENRSSSLGRGNSAMFNSVSECWENFLSENFGIVHSDHSPVMNKALSNYLSILIAREEVLRFQPIAFKTFLKGNPLWSGQKWQLEGCDFLRTNSGASLGLGEVDSAQLNWIQHISMVSMPWYGLMSPGPWLDDTRAQFIIVCLETLAKEKKYHADYPEISNCQLFRLLVNDWRPRLPASFLPNVMVIVEGLTEAILLPIFARSCGLDFARSGIMILPAGGAKQVVRKYEYLKEILTIPIVCLFDLDAQSQSNLVKASLREGDAVYVLNDGEIEDAFQLDFFIHSLNQFLATKNCSALGLQEVRQEDFAETRWRMPTLNRLWGERHLGPFNKIEFAQFIGGNLSTLPQLTNQAETLVRRIAGVLRT